MRSGDKFQAIVPIEFVYYFMAEEPSRASTAVRPGVYLLGIRPHQVGKRPLRGYLHFSIKFSDLVKRMNIGWKSTMNAKNLVFLLNEKVPSMIAPNGR